METQLTLIAIVGAAWIVAALEVRQWWRRERTPTWLDNATRRRVVVQTADGQSIHGHLVMADEHGLTLEPVEVDGTALAGVVWVPRSRVRWIQDPDPIPTEV